ncbi:MAG: flagellar hook-associated protein FlgL [Fibrobacter sp.]|nr:flagellar hook-associated protein FlgL [Fibrobacter sp.]
MRITVQELNRQVLHVINDRNYDMSKLQQQIATGKRLLKPSDDPVDVANTLKLETKLKENVQFKKNINDGVSYMNVTSTALDSMNTLMQRARELAVQGSNDTLSANERAYLNRETSQLFRQMIALVNTEYKGDFIFSGTHTKTAPYEIYESQNLTAQNYINGEMAYFNAGAMAVGSTVQLFNGFDNTVIRNIIPDSFSLSVAGVNYVENTDYTIDYTSGEMTILNAALLVDATPGTANYAPGQVAISFESINSGRDIYGNSISNWGEIYREIESGITMPININADEMTRDAKTGYDMIGTMIRFGQNLVQNNQPGIENAIDEIDAVFSAMLSAQSINGARINRFETTLDRNESNYISTSEIQSQLADTDLADAVMQYATMENVYNAALRTAAKIIQPSLVNYL